MGRPTKPLEQKRRHARSATRDIAGRKLPDASTVTQMPGVAEIPPVPVRLRTTDGADNCYVARARDPARPCEVCLAEVGAEAWTRLWSAGKSWLSVRTDLDVLTRICLGRIDELHLRLVLEEDGPFTKGQRGGLVAHPAFSQLRGVLAEVVKLESLCGFNPSDRGRLGVAEVKPGDGEVDIVARRTAPRRAAKVPDRATARKRAVGSGQD
ncbi:MAG TPA: P27 family phage terminase small subunit [Mycobacterium sp.]|jgi:P27 family predicted phage terminase small subunit|uniref:P27 family phage terminase small subunit n=1 Tax=Mycobacterium sp. TaxID=1785 RepID=UPI002F4098A7